jgi:photosystem II stability/assembly factor-like uncharacterized protein
MRNLAARAGAAAFGLLFASPALAQWAPEASGTTETLRAIHFVSRTHGWAAGYNGTIIRTTNGGTTWSPASSGVTDRLLHLRFVDASHGWAGAQKKIVRTTNGGATWTIVPVDPNFLITRDAFFPVSPTVAWASGWQSPPLQRWLYRYTLNPDSSVSEQVFDLTPNASPHFYDLFFTDPDNGWAVGGSGVIRRITAASSATPGFASQTSGTIQQLNGVFMVDAARGWIVGHGGTILRTTNGGASWTPQGSGTTANLRDVYFVNPDCGWAVGDGGIILRTTNAGLVWTQESSGATTTLWSVDGLAAAHAAGGNEASSANSVLLGQSPPDLLLAAQFEEGTLDEWSGAVTDLGDLAASAAAAAPGTAFGLQAIVDDQAGVYVQDETPLDESRYRARFYLNPGAFDPGEGAGHFRTRIFLGFDASPTRRLFAIVLRRRDNVYAIAARVTRDDGTRATTAFTALGSGMRAIELDWRRASAPGAADGGFELWIDGVSAATLSAIDNDAGALDYVRLGALSVKAGASGILYWDELESRRQSYIGPLPE